MNIPRDIAHFLGHQGFVMVSTLDARGSIHCSAKGLVCVNQGGWALIADLYQGSTYQNLERNPIVTITAINEQKFMGYSLQGKAEIVPRSEIDPKIISQWEDKITQRISHRVIQGVKTGMKSETQFESHLPPQPKYLIRININQIIDLAPPGRRTK